MSQFRQIKASAGSGKTFTLTSRFLSLLAVSSGASWQKAPSGCALPEDGRYGWQEIMAITFTNKAATEMRERVLSRLKDHALAAPSKRRKGSDDFWTPARARAAVDMLIKSYSALNIRTIDSLIHLMVRLSALDFDLSPDFEPTFNEADITGPIFDAMAEQARDGDSELAAAFRRACRQILFSEQTTGFLAGERIRTRVLTLTALLLEADSRSAHGDAPATEGSWNIGDLASPAEAEEHFQGLLHGVMEDARALRLAMEQEGVKASKNLLNALDKCEGCGGMASRLPWTSTMFSKEGLDECLLKASKGQASTQAHALYASLCDDFAELRVLKGARRLMPFAELAQAVFSRLGEHERRAGIIASSQMPTLAKRAADDTEGVNELLCRLGSRITHILIDEFQDTSREQWNALQPLAQEALARGGSLTIVGDVKQAIYGWRGGDAALFDQLVRPGSPLLIQCPEPARETLPYNWRSRERIVAWNNALFPPIADRDHARALLEALAEGDMELLEEQASLLQDAFVSASQSAEKCRPGGFVRLRHMKKGEEEEVTASELPLLVEKLGQTRRWGDICILTRDGKQASKAAAWLMARHIPVVTEGSLLLMEQPVIAELVSLLRFLNSPDDDIAFWDVLTGEHIFPATGNAATDLPDKSSLIDWAARRPRRRSLALQFSRDFPEVWQELFSALHDSAGLVTPYDAAIEIIERWRIMERFPSAAGFVRRFLEVLFNAEEQGIADLSGFLDFWDASKAQEKAPLPESMDAVRIMTMHKAKGLEFHTVILPWLNFSMGRVSDDKAVFWNSRGTGVIAPLCSDMGRLWRRSRMESVRESLHLVYVAMTRAVSELHCFIPSPEAGVFPAMLDTLLSRQYGSLRQEGDESFWGEEEELPLINRAEPAQAQEADVEASLPKEAGAIADDPDSLGANGAPCPPLEKAPQLSELSAASLGAHEEEEGIDEDEAWRPMGWLPRLRMFRSPLEDWTFTAKRRGTLIHHCLECLQVSGIGTVSARRDAELAAARGISTSPLPIPDRDAVQAEVTEDLAWFASQEETPHWLAFGTPEHALLDGDGRQFRVDLLVDDGRELVAVEYKTGTYGALPAPEHVSQLSRYLSLLGQASSLPVRGVLVYLDRRQMFPILPGDVR